MRLTGEFSVRDDFQQGEPCVAGTGVPMSVIGRLLDAPDLLLRRYPHLELVQVIDDDNEIAWMVQARRPE